MAARITLNDEVGGSTPSTPTIMMTFEEANEYRKQATLLADCRPTFFELMKDGSVRFAARKRGKHSYRGVIRNWDTMTPEQFTGIIYRLCVMYCPGMSDMHQRQYKSLAP